MEWVQIVLAIVTGVATAIPLVIKLVDYAQKLVRERNWSAMLKLVMGYMGEAESRFSSGADKKEWVMGMVELSANTVAYDMDIAVIEDMIDQLCSLSKVVNPPKQKAGDEA